MLAVLRGLLLRLLGETVWRHLLLLGGPLLRLLLALAGMLIPTNNTELIKAAATLRFKVWIFTAYLFDNPVASRAVT